MKPTISIMIPALNEEGNVAGAVSAVAPLMDSHFSDYEILIFNDGSTDKTGEIADNLSKQNPKIRVIHNPKPLGLGYNYKRGLAMARFEYYMMVPGDNDLDDRTYKELFPKVGEADIIVPFTFNKEARPLGRQVASFLFTWMLNILFQKRLKYYNGVVVHKTALLKKITIETDSFAYQAEALIKLLNLGHSYVYTPQYIGSRQMGRSKAFHPKNVVRVFKAVSDLFLKIHF